MDASESRRRFAEARVARLATRGEGTPRLVPIVFAIAGDDIVTAVDHKPKSTRDLRRLSDIADDPRVALLVDHYDDADWSRLWWVRADGIATVHDGDATAHRAIDHSGGPLLAISQTTSCRARHRRVGVALVRLGRRPRPVGSRDASPTELASRSRHPLSPGMGPSIRPPTDSICAPSPKAASGGSSWVDQRARARTSSRVSDRSS